jgi:drug/metabolite transporter (DMT)-like permease
VRPRPLDWALAGLLLTIWVSFHLISRATSRETLTAWDLAALRFAGAFLSVLPILAWRGLPAWPWRRVVVVLALAGFGFPLTVYAGYQFAPAAHGAVITAAGLAVVTALLAAALGLTRIGLRQGAALALVAVGGLLLAAAGGGAAGPDAWRGDLLFLAANCCWACFTLLVQRWGLRPLEVTLVIGLLAAPLYVPLWWLALPSGLAQAGTGTILFQMLFHGTGATVVAMLLYTRTVHGLGPTRTTMMGAVVPGLAALGAWALLGEPLAALGWVAVALACGGVALSVRRG